MQVPALIQTYLNVRFIIREKVIWHFHGQKHRLLFMLPFMAGKVILIVSITDNCADMVAAFCFSDRCYARYNSLGGSSINYCYDMDEQTLSFLCKYVLKACVPYSNLNCSQTDLASGEHSSKYVDTALPFVSHAGTCTMTERDVCLAERPVSPGTQQPLALPAGTLLHQLHKAPSPGRAPRSVGQQSTHAELQRSQCGMKGRKV